jgi:hypothetical protein
MRPSNRLLALECVSFDTIKTFHSTKRHPGYGIAITIIITGRVTTSQRTNLV